MVNKIKAGEHFRTDIKKVLTPLGGIEVFVKAGERVLLKPNFNTSDPFPASSDLDFICAVISEIESQKPAQIILGESPTFFGNSRKYFDEKDPKSLEAKYSCLKVLYLPEEEWVQKENPEAKYLTKASVPKILDEVDKIILLPCLKTHAWAQYTGALKLSVGLLKPTERIKLHAGHLQEKIAELNLLIKPDLVIMDARKCFITDGPSQGKIAEPGLFLASPNRVELDLEGIKIIQSYQGNDLADIKPEELPQIKQALALGLK